MLSALLWTWTTMAQAPPWKQLHSPEAVATSYLKSSWNRFEENYHPNYVLDGDPKTAWVEGVEGQGEGSTITLPVSVLSSARAVQLRVRNGYQKSSALLKANGAPSAVTAIVLYQGIEIAQVQGKLTRGAGLQTLTVALPPGKPMDAVALRIDAVSPGSAYKDTCISDIEVWVDSDVPYQAQVEQAHHQRLLDWKAQRLADAAWLAQSPAEWPIAEGTWVVGHIEPPASVIDFAALTAPYRAAAQQRAGAPQRLSFVRDLPEWDNGVRWIDPAYAPDMLNYNNLTFFESNTSVARNDYIPEKDQNAREEQTLADLHILPPSTPDAPGIALTFTSYNQSHARTATLQTGRHFLQYDAQGRLITWWYERGEPSVEIPCPGNWRLREQLTHWQWSPEGRVIGVQHYLMETYWFNSTDTCSAPPQFEWSATAVRFQEAPPNTPPQP